MERVDANTKTTSKEASKANSRSKSDGKDAVRNEDAEGQKRLLIGAQVFYRKGDRICPAQVLEFRNGKAVLAVIDANTPVKPIAIEKNVLEGFDSGEFSRSLDELCAFIGIENASAT